jgi:pheromone shutdown-related protein TraB
MIYRNLRIIGTSHIAKDSVKEIKRVANEFAPEIVAVELDKKRLYALMHDLKPDYSLSNISRIGFKGYLFAVIGGLIQRKLGDIVGVKPGSDMHEAVKYAQANNTMLALIDQDIEITLNKFSKRFSFKERMRFIWDLLTGWARPKMRINLAGVPDDELIKQLMGILKKRYPNLYYTLVEERNKVMSKRLVKLMRDYPDKKILCVVGAGHKEEMMALIKEMFESSKFDIVNN